MGLLNKIFKRGDTQTTQFEESDSDPAGGSKNAPRRELVHVVLRDTMRQHGIPTDWIDCAILSVVNENTMTGMHVHLIVRNGHDRLLAYVPAFQSSFMSAITKFEPRVSDWLLSLCWQFEGMANTRWEPMPDPKVWTGAAAAAGAASAASSDADDVEEDLKALFAIRDAAMKGDVKPPPGHTDFQPTQPGL
ncbi:MAG: hypothetical protein EOO25_05240 [Comamonadaceae bacterium]|nr:MAG: hypothetical protein EOO25_05240 [Comamonadaceae bacterium]